MLRFSSALFLTGCILGGSGVACAQDATPPVTDQATAQPNTTLPPNLEESSATPTPPEKPLYTVQVLAVNSAKISAPMGGRVTILSLRDGDSFKKGDVLVGFDCLLAKSQNAHAKAEVQKYKALVETQNNLRQLQSWSASDYRTTKADLAAAEADLGVTQATLSNCTVVAPFDGKVSEMPVHQDQFVTLGAPLISIVDPSELELSFLIPAKLLVSHPVGTHFHVTIDETGKSYEAVLTRVSGAADPVSRTIRVYGKIDTAHEGLFPGMTGDANF